MARSRRTPRTGRAEGVGTVALAMRLPLPTVKQRWHKHGGKGVSYAEFVFGAMPKAPTEMHGDCGGGGQW